MSNKDEEHENEYEDYAEYQNRLDSGEEVFEEVIEYVDGYFNIDENTGELTHGPISIGRIIIIDDEIHTELDPRLTTMPVGCENVWDSTIRAGM
jgi:hypothetical protein